MPVSDQGVDRGRYQVIPRTLIFLSRGAEILLLKGAATKRLWANRYNGIGGHLERGEDPLAGARRELLEETGLEAPDLWLSGVVTIDTGENPGILLFVMRGEAGPDSPALQPSQEGGLEWVPIDQALGLPLVEDLYTLLPRLLRQGRGEPPFSARYSYDLTGELVISFS